MGDSTADRGQPGDADPRTSPPRPCQHATDLAEATNQAVLQPLTSSPANMRRVRVEKVLDVVAEPPRNVRFRSIIPTEEVDHDEPSP